MTDEKITTVMLVAGGTGGHVFPAIALADSLIQKNIRCVFIGDKRTEDLYLRNNRKVHRITAATFGAGIFNKIKAVVMIFAGLIESFDILREEKPDVVVGFGGYPSFPTILAAQILRIPTVLHEQNSVLGRANRALLRRASWLALSFENTKFVTTQSLSKATVTGNPVRSVFTNNLFPYPSLNQNLHLTIIGGSQGSRFFNDIIPAAIALLPDSIRSYLNVTQQVRAQDLDTVRLAYAKIGVRAVLAPFFDDMPALYRDAHLLICRAGASTVAEITAVGRPALFIPLAASLDGDQAQNAAALVANNAGWVITEDEATPERLAAHLAQLLGHPDLLKQAAIAATAMGRIDAADQLANLVLKHANV